MIQGALWVIGIGGLLATIPDEPGLRKEIWGIALTVAGIAVMIAVGQYAGVLHQ